MVITKPTKRPRFGPPRPIKTEASSGRRHRETAMTIKRLILLSAVTGVKVAVAVYFLEGGKRQIASDDMTVEGEAWVSPEVASPASGWPLGKYEVEFLL